MGEPRRHEGGRPALHVGERPVPETEPVRRLAGQDGADRLVGARMAGRQSEVLPRHPGQLRGGWVPRVVGVGEGHPAEPRLVGAERGEPVDGQVGHPVGVVPLPRDRVVLRLGRQRVPARFGLQQAGEAVQVLGMVGFEPAAVVGDRMVTPRRGVHRLLGPLEAAPGTGVAARHPRVLLELVRRVEAGLEVRLAQQRGPVARCVVEVLRHRRRIDRQGDPVGHHAVRPHVLAREHGRACRHAHRVLVVGPAVVDALGRPAVHHRRAGHGAPVAAEAVVALLVGGDEEDVAPPRRGVGHCLLLLSTMGCAPGLIRRAACGADPTPAPPSTRPGGAGAPGHRPPPTGAGRRRH